MIEASPLQPSAGPSLGDKQYQLRLGMSRKGTHVGLAHSSSVAPKPHSAYCIVAGQPAGGCR
jgi:hypothetical protein